MTEFRVGMGTVVAKLIVLISVLILLFFNSLKQKHIYCRSLVLEDFPYPRFRLGFVLFCEKDPASLPPYFYGKYGHELPLMKDL